MSRPNYTLPSPLSGWVAWLCTDGVVEGLGNKDSCKLSWLLVQSELRFPYAFLLSCFRFKCQTQTGKPLLHSDTHSRDWNLARYYFTVLGVLVDIAMQLQYMLLQDRGGGNWWVSLHYLSKLVKLALSALVPFVYFVEMHRHLRNSVRTMLDILDCILPQIFWNHR